jgi:hypothetical protein
VAEIKKVIVGQTKSQTILIALFCKGHCLLVGVRGSQRCSLCRRLQVSWT